MWPLLKQRKCIRNELRLAVQTSNAVTPTCAHTFAPRSRYKDTCKETRRHHRCMMIVSRAMPNEASLHCVTISILTDQRIPPKPSANFKAHVRKIAFSTFYKCATVESPQNPRPTKSRTRNAFELEARAKRAPKRIEHQMCKHCIALVARGGRTQNQPRFCILKLATFFYALFQKKVSVMWSAPGCCK